MIKRNEKIEKCGYKEVSFANSTYDYVEMEDGAGKKYLLKQYSVIGDEFRLLSCFATGKFLTPEDVDEHQELFLDKDNRVYCKAFVEDEMRCCDYCHRWVDKKDVIYTEEGSCYCNDCVEEEEGLAYQCDDCGTWHNAWHYRNCGVEGMSYDYHGVMVHYCEKCSEFRFVCERCGRVVGEDNVGFTDFGTYCYECYDQVSEEENDKVVHEYHYDGDETDYGMEWLGYKNDKNEVLEGVEVEMDKGGQDWAIVQSILDAIGSDHCIACEDGSVRQGIEVISCPATLSHHKNTLDWKKGFETARAYGYRGHDGGKCGIHVHVDRSYFQSAEMTMDDVEGCMFIALKNNTEWIKKFSRRFDYGYCAINGTDDGTKIKDYEEYDKKWNKSAKGKRHDRYQAINFSRSDTIEFRVFRGTLNIDTFYAILEMVDMFCKFIKECDTTAEAMDIDLDMFVDYANHHEGYEHFVPYCKSIGIVDDNETGF